MASSPAGVSSPPASSKDVPKIHAGVAPLRTGQGSSYFWRRLHSLSGIIPVGAFLLEHILFSNAMAINGPQAYARQVRFLGSLPLVVMLEAFGIWLPITFHGLYGFYIWYRGETNVISYPWQGNWMYTLQRWTGAIIFAYIAWHVWHLRFTGVDLHQTPGASFGKVQLELAQPALLAFYIVGLLCAAWHFSYGVWLFCAKWGITVGEKARQRFLVVCMLLFLTISGVGLMSIRSFITHPQQPVEGPAAESVETGH
ncbi:MAG TPA: succinate dehydrogenase cytochrome b558 subunit [Terriglobales bacterium]|nr:succinate dehydrogenase cytochrome b558 subunit [Terriglobales bacterium]